MPGADSFISGALDMIRARTKDVWQAESRGAYNRPSTV